MKQENALDALEVCRLSVVMTRPIFIDYFLPSLSWLLLNQLPHLVLPST